MSKFFFSQRVGYVFFLLKSNKWWPVFIFHHFAHHTLSFISLNEYKWVHMDVGYIALLSYWSSFFLGQKVLKSFSFPTSTFPVTFASSFWNFWHSMTVFTRFFEIQKLPCTLPNTKLGYLVGRLCLLFDSKFCSWTFTTYSWTFLNSLRLHP